MTKLRIWPVAILCLALLAGAAPRKPQSIEALMGTALRQEEVEGNLETAIATYKKVIAANGAPRALAANAQYRIGLCYEKLGNTEARKAFERVLTTYQDQKDTVALARARLSALEAVAPKAAEAKGLSLRQIKINPQFMGRPSPDGRYLAYADKEDDVAVYDLNTGTSRKITHKDIKLEGFPENLSWSPDGNRIAYVWNTRKNKEYFFELRVVGFDGSAPRSLYDSNDKSIECLSWFPDGMSIIVANDSPSQLVRVPVDKGSVQIIKTISQGAWDLDVSPDGKFIACSVYPAEIFLIPSLGGSETTIVREKGLVRLFGWDVEGKSVLFTSDRSGTIGLWRVMIANGKLLAEPELVKADVGNVWPEGSTRSGSYYYTVGGRQQDIYISTLDMAGGKVVAPPKRVNSTNIGSCASPAWSPDGKHLAYLAAATPSQTVSYSKVCIWSAVDGTQREYVLNISLGATGYPISWSADGRFLQGRAYNGAKTDIVRINAQTGEVFAVASNQKGDIPDWGRGVMFEWSPDTKTVFKNLTGPNSSGPIGVLAYDLASGRETELFRSSEGTQVTAALGKPLSPDGKWLAMRIDGQEQTPPPRSYKLIAIQTEGGSVRELAVLTHWQGPYYLTWSPDGKHVLYPLTDRSRGVAELWEVPLDRGVPRNLGLEVPGFIGQISLNPDGKRIAFQAGQTRPRELWVIENIPALKPAGK